MSLISEVLGVDQGIVEGYIGEAGMIDRQVEEKIRGKDLWALTSDKRKYLYAVIKILTPEKVVETGVGSGVSTTFILSALNKGILYSIDLGVKYGEEEETYPVGFVVPEKLKGKWRLIIGDSKKVLPELLSELGIIQVFLHDGDHTYENVKFELSLAWDHMNEGIILVDNFEFNSATRDFCKEKGCTVLKLSDQNGGFAMIKKT
ncbi:hypothetical protein HS7_13140 [Sulfolobales archaeon HS-7]|nr:hypothetical protein HS7_13140 [Sulfolobales archaeon HS-7]